VHPLPPFPSSPKVAKISEFDPQKIIGLKLEETLKNEKVEGEWRIWLMRDSQNSGRIFGLKLLKLPINSLSFIYCTYIFVIFVSFFKFHFDSILHSFPFPVHHPS